MKKHLVAGVGALVFFSSSVEAQTLGIEHQPVGCVMAEKFPRLEARFAPADTVATARVLFQGQNPEWYSVAMKPEGVLFVGVLPKPKKSLKSFRYYIEVTDRALGTNRTADYTTAVVDSSSACKGKVVAGALGSASVILQGPAGVVALPAGFASSGVVVAGSAAGSGSAAGAAGASAAGGGVGATALVLGGVAVAGGAVAVAAAKGGGDDNSSASGGSPPPLYGVAFLPPGVDVSVCAGRQLTWSSHNVSPDANGNFNQTWSVNEPNTMRVTGQVTATTFQATLTCVNGARSGSLSATGSNNSYNGTFAFGPSTGQVAITKER